MSRWGRGRGGSVAVPLEHLFRENSNCPSAARSTATVGKWGITSFTSTRSAPYSFIGEVNSYQKKPKQDQNSPLTVPALEVNAPPPKPKKFFKSRNVDPSEDAALPTSSVAPPSAPPAYAGPAFRRDDKPSRSGGYSKKSPKRGADKLEIPKLKIHVDRSTKSTKGKFFATKALKKEDPPVEEKTHLSPNKRYLVRNRDKVINYSEDRSNSPPPPPPAAPPPPAPRVSTPRGSPAVAASPTYVKPGLLSPTNKDGKPPIVLRISKGTSRLLSTDSEDVVTSPAADRHSSSDRCMDAEDDRPEAEPPAVKQESLKITIKCFGSGKDKSSKIKGEKSGHKSETATSDSDKDTGHHGRSGRGRRHQQREGAEGVRVASPVPGSDNYELYRTLASPPAAAPPSPACLSPRLSRVLPPDVNSDNDVEMTLAQSDSGKPVDVPVAPRNGVQTKMPALDNPENRDNPTGRAMRHRANINYNENVNSYIDDITAKFNKNPAKNYGRKNKKKPDVPQSPRENVADSAPTSDIVTQLPEPVPKLSPESHSARTESEIPPPVTQPSVESEVREAKIDSPVRDDAADRDRAEPEPEGQSESIEDVKSGEKLNKVEKHTFKSPMRLVSEGSPTSGDADDKPSVKLVITKKKGSIFKSRSLVNDGPGATGKKRHLYKHKWADDGKGGQTPRPEPEPSAQAALQEFEENQVLTRVTRYQKDKLPSIEDEIEPYTSVKCPKNAKDYYTVVRNVKKAHQIQEIGEFQEFNDDVEYILDALQDNNPMSTRCLSAITLASKCTAPAFRMHVRAHGTVAKFFRALHDATNDQSLGLCTATVMFVLSQDRLNMDLDKESLELMLNLLESDVSHKDALDDCGLTSVQLAKNKERVRELCAEIKSQDKAKHLDLDNITVGHLAMETLLSLTSKRAGEWFKEELRVLGGVDHILSTICDCCATIGDYGVEWSPQLLDLLRKVDRCMRVLENVTQQNEENQTYLVNWKSGLAVDTLVGLFRLCDREIPLYPTSGGHHSTGATIRDALLPTLKVLINLTHPFSFKSIGAAVIGERPGIIESSLHLLLQAPNYIPEQNNFEFSVCVLLLLINLMQNNPANIKLLMEAKAPADHEAVFTCNKPALQALIDHFYKREELARLAEKNTDAILDGEKVKEDEPKEKKNKSHDDIEETVEKLLQKAGTHMEHTMVGSYVVLLLGHVVMDGAEYEARVRNLLPQPSFRDMLLVLRKYYSFLNLTASAEAASVAHVKGTEKIINFLDNCDKQYLANTEAGTGMEEQSPANYSSLDITNNSNATNDYTSESDRLSSSVDMDTSFN